MESNLPLSNYNYDVWGYVDKNTGNEYALVGMDTGLAVIDVTHPANPVLVSVGKMPYLINPNENIVRKPAADVRVWNQYAYVVSGIASGYGGIFDLSDPSNVVLIDSMPDAHTLFIDDNGYLYLECPGLHIYDLKPNPLKPTLIWHHHHDNVLKVAHDAPGLPLCHASFVKNNRLYAFEGGYGFEIFDITDINSPKLEGNIIDTNIRLFHSGWVSEDEKYLYICDEFATKLREDITVWNIADPSNPYKVGGFVDTVSRKTAHNIFIKDGVAYVSYYNAGFRIFDVSLPGEIKMIAEFLTDSTGIGGGAYGVYPYSPSGKIFVSDLKQGLFVFSVKLPALDGFTNFENISAMKLFPNPADDQCLITFYDIDNIMLSVSIYDITGRQVRNFKKFERLDSKCQILWDLTNEEGQKVDNGIYLVKVSGDGYSVSTKLRVK